jgi:hypothetical protein
VSITDNQTAPSNISATATSTSAVASDLAPLVDSAASFSTTVNPLDLIHNVTDSSDGLVISVTNGTTLQTKLWGGTNNFWTSGDTYIIVPQGRKSLVVDPPSNVSGHTITVPYIQKPNPVYSKYASYRFDPMFGPAIVKYAAWLFKYRDREPQYGDAWYQYWSNAIARATAVTNKAYDRTRFRVNMIKRSLYDRSYR